MPAEYVRGIWQPDEEVELLVRIGWGHEIVQVACIGRATVTHETVGANDAEGWYVSLDRGGINDLIRQLRRARDRAFGRDE